MKIICRKRCATVCLPADSDFKDENCGFPLLNLIPFFLLFSSPLSHFNITPRQPLFHLSVSIAIHLGLWSFPHTILHSIFTYFFYTKT